MDMDINHEATPTRYDVAMPRTNIIGISELADLLGIGILSARAYNTRAALHRKEAREKNNPDLVRPGDLPIPDGRFGNSPYWEEATINKWLEQRPGRGGHNKGTAKENARKKGSRPHAA
jgi:hypothetical protein